MKTKNRKIRNIFPAAMLMLLVASGCNDNELPSGSGGGDGTPKSSVTYVLTDFGADPTGNADSTPAFEAMFQTMAGKKQVEVFVPAGKFRISKRVVFDQQQFAGYSENSGIHFRGAGEDVTELICDNADGGFLFNVKTNLLTVTVSDMSFVASRRGQGTAIEFNTGDENAGDHHSRMFHSRNILIRGTIFNEGYFNNGVILKNAWYPLLENVKITTEYGDSTARMNEGFQLYNCYSPLIDKCYFWGPANYGLRYWSSHDDEDGVISDSYFVGQDVGVYAQLSRRTDEWVEPAFHVSGCHIHYKVKGIELKGIRQGFINSNLFYCFNVAGSKFFGNTDPATVFESKDVEFNACFDFIVSNNQFTEPASPKRFCIDILPSSGDILIDGNIFNMDGTAIRNQSEKTSRCIGNVFSGTPDFTRANWSAGEVVMTRYDDTPGKLIKMDFAE